MKIATRRQLLVNDSPFAHEDQGKHDPTTRHMNKPAKNGRLVIGSMAALLLLAIGSGSAIAQAPANDTIAGATPAIVGYDYEPLDTTEADTDDDDLQLNQSCGFQATDASVWYAYTASSDVSVIVDVSQSSYVASIMVGTGTLDNLDIWHCGYSFYNPQSFRAIAGQTYYILVFDGQDDGGGNGGDLNISFDEVPVPVVEEFTVNRNGQFDSQTGDVTISGSYTCSNGDFMYLSTTATQTVGRFTSIRGFNDNFINAECDQQPHPWHIEVFPSEGKFAGSKVVTRSYVEACGQYDCDYRDVTQVVQLRRVSSR